KIGVIQPLSGPVAASGNYIRMGAEIARDWINVRGGIAGRKVDLLIEDNKSDPKEAASAAEKLIVRDKVPVIMGAWGSSMTLAAMPKLEEYGVPMVVETSSASSVTKRGNPWVFRISPPSEMEALGLEKYLKDLGIKKADFLAVNTDWGRGAGAAAEGTYHILFFLPWFPEAMPDGKLAKAFVDEWTKRGHPFEGLTEGFRGHDGIATAVEAVRLAGKPDPKAVREALWKVSLMGANGPIKFE